MNKYFDLYISAYIKPFNHYYNKRFKIIIYNLGNFIDYNNEFFLYVIKQLSDNGFDICFKNTSDTVCELGVEYSIEGLPDIIRFEVPIMDLQSMIELSSKSSIPYPILMIMKIIARIICRHKIQYKAIVLDLDETLWPGILVEDGIENIKLDLSSDIGKSYIAFMNYVKVLAENLGIYVAICSRNNINQVQFAIEELEEDIFPLKNNIDYIIANNNDKSENIKAIATELSILPNAIVFIDDSQIVRDEVRGKMPEVLVLDWKQHSELMTQLNVACIFERFELSVNSQKRRNHLRIIKAEKKNNLLPKLYVKINTDENNIEAKKMYAKSNQFKLVQEDIKFDNAKSLVFELFRENGDSLGICSTVTYTMVENSIGGILNWAISCRYFEIGLEEFILIYLLQNSKKHTIYFALQRGENNKAQKFIDKYYGSIITDDCSSVPTDCLYLSFEYTDINFADLLNRLKCSLYNVYYVDLDNNGFQKLRESTNLILLE